MKNPIRICLILLLSSLLAACASHPIQPSEAFLAAQPKSILVLPPSNTTNEPLAPYVYLSTINQLLGERGYYVFPVAVVDEFMKNNGYSIPEEMHQIPMDKLSSVFGQDAVLYINIDRFGQDYFLIASSTVVSAHAKLVSSKSGQILWEGSAYHSESSNGNNNSLAAMMVQALVDQVVDSLSMRVRQVSYIANDQMINSNPGLPKGPYRIQREIEEAAQGK